jgi:hypothetical protein
MYRFTARLTALIPDGWFARESIQLASAEHDAFVVGSADVLPPGTTVEQYAEQYGEQLRERLPNYQELELEQATLPGGRPAFIRKFRWAPPDGDPVAELQMYTVENGRGIIASGRTAEETFGELEQRLRELLAGIGVGSAPPAGGIMRRDASPQSRTYDALETGQLSTTPTEAFGLDATNGSEDVTPEQVGAAWGDVRTSWQQVREEL